MNIFNSYLDKATLNIAETFILNNGKMILTFKLPKLARLNIKFNFSHIELSYKCIDLINIWTQ